MTLTKGVVLMECFNEIDDPRKASNGTRDDFREMLVMAIVGVLSDCDSVEDITSTLSDSKPPICRCHHV